MSVDNRVEARLQNARLLTRITNLTHEATDLIVQAKRAVNACNHLGALVRLGRAKGALLEALALSEAVSIPDISRDMCNRFRNRLGSVDALSEIVGRQIRD
jgi:hypothetical protein